MNSNVQILSPLSRFGSYDVTVGTSLAEVHTRYASHLPTVLVLNGAPVMRAEWSRIVQDGDELALMIIPGKGGFKQILGAVALIALAVVAPQIGLAIAGSAGLAATAISAGVVLAGSLLVNALLSPSTKGSKSYDAPSASPTYSISADGNQARLLQPIPRLYGRHILNPDYAAKPYSYYQKNEQFLCQLFCLGVGYYDLNEIRIDKTTIFRDGNFTDSYAAFEIVKYEPGQPVTLFRPEVETSSEVSGQDLNKNINVNIGVNFVQNTVFVDTGTKTTAEVDTDQYVGNYRPGDIVNINSGAGNSGNYTVIDVDKVNFKWIMVNRTFPYQGADLISMTNVNYIGPFVVNPPRTTIDRIELDFVFPGGLNHTTITKDGPVYDFPTDKVQIEYRRIDGIGQALENWNVTTADFAFPTFNTQRVMNVIPNLVPARYEVRMRRLTKQFYGQGWNSTIQWQGLKGYYIADGIYPDVTTLAIKIRADNQISSQNSRKFATIQTARLPQWNGSSFPTSSTDFVPTRRISDALLDAARNQIYGIGMPQSRIDIDGIMALEAIWSARGDTFDGVFDTKYTAWDALSALLFVGRSKPIIIGGKLTAVRDQARMLPRSVFTPYNIKQNSFELEHVMNDENSPTDAIISFMDERTWTLNEVECYIDDADRDNPARIDGFGIVKRDQAWREGIYQVASNKYRRIFATFGTELEGKLLLPMDKVVINHDLPRYGQSGILEQMSNDGLFWFSTEPFVMPTGAAYTALRTKSGTVWGPVAVASLRDDGKTIELNQANYAEVAVAQGSALDFVNVGYENEGEPAAIMFGTLDSYVKPFRVVSASPKSEYEVTVLCCNEDDRVHTAETDYTIPTEQ